MKSRRAPSWQLILADLALILFLVTLSALAARSSDEAEGKPEESASNTPGSNPNLPPIAASQALFRPNPLGPTLDEWLDEQPADPRATLTIFARYSAGDREAVWRQAQAFASSAAVVAEEKKYTVRVVISQANDSAIYASLAYDTLRDVGAEP